MSKLTYEVAEHAFCLLTSGNADWDTCLQQYAPFSVSEPASQPVFELEAIARGAQLAPAVEGFTEEQRQSDEASVIIVGQVAHRPCFEFVLHGRLSARLTATTDYRQGTVELGTDPGYGLNNALMVMYALSTACSQTALFHASVVGYRQRGYLFLGKSGTGKSTHSALWLKHIAGTELLNDDNPVVRMVDGEPRVYGSPWSGKTPCYRNVVMPIGAIVSLSQAPYNAIHRLRSVEAYGVLMSSISGKRWDSRIADGLHETESLLIAHTDMWHLACLPDREAALMCCRQVTAGQPT